MGSKTAFMGSSHSTVLSVHALALGKWAAEQSLALCLLSLLL